MKREILVEVGYYDFYFDYMTDALTFARMAAEHICKRNRDEEIVLTAEFTKAEETSKDGED